MGAAKVSICDSRDRIFSSLEGVYSGEKSVPKNDLS
jgi:hypothetical protein